jgi:hypothetical protein
LENDIMSTWSKAIGSGILAVMACAAQGDVFHFEANLSGLEQNPPVITPATGMVWAQYDDVANTLDVSWQITDNLIGAPSAPGAHLHMGAVGTNGPVVFGFNAPDGTWDLMGSAQWTDLSTEHVDALFGGNLYANFHTDAFPGGEVRGQVLLVPAPGAAGVVGLMGLAGAARRRRH